MKILVTELMWEDGIEDLKAKGAKFDSELSKWHSRELIDGYPYIKVFVPLRIYSDGLLGYYYGYAENESTFSSETRLNYRLDDLRKEIQDAEKEL